MRHRIKCDYYSSITWNKSGFIKLTAIGVMGVFGINNFTHVMASQPDSKSKQKALQETGTFNPRAEKVRHALFGKVDFFDPQDLTQLKYETLRSLEVDGYSIARAASEFGLSRPTIYQAQDQFQGHGLEGLLPHKRGPKNPHKLTPEVVQFVQELTASTPELEAKEIARRIQQRFKIKLHPRTIEKALHSKAKRGPQTSS